MVVGEVLEGGQDVIAAAAAAVQHHQNRQRPLVPPCACEDEVEERASGRDMHIALAARASVIVAMMLPCYGWRLLVGADGETRRGPAHRM